MERAYRLVGVPLWMLFVVSAVSIVILWWRDGRGGLVPGLCRKCGHDLAGAEHEKRPECRENVAELHGS